MNEEIECNCCKDYCKHISIEIDAPQTEEEFQNIRGHLLHKNIGISIVESENEEVDEDNDENELEERWFLEVLTPCKKLDSHEKCSIYDSRPPICKQEDEETCEESDENEENEEKNDEITYFTDADMFWNWVLERYDFVEEEEKTLE